MGKIDLILKSEKRTDFGKTSSKIIRNSGKLPAVVYGPDLKENIDISVNYQEFEKLFAKSGRHFVFGLEAGGKTYDVIVKEYKFHPITRNYLHVDFYAVSKKREFTTEVPLKYIGSPVGVKEGGSLFTFSRKVKIKTDVKNLPESIEVDISNLTIKQYMIVREIKRLSEYKILTHEGDVLVEIK